jgi:hypothetical protein
LGLMAMASTARRGTGTRRRLQPATLGWGTPPDRQRPTATTAQSIREATGGSDEAKMVVLARAVLGCLVLGCLGWVQRPTSGRAALTESSRYSTLGEGASKCAISRQMTAARKPRWAKGTTGQQMRRCAMPGRLAPRSNDRLET